MINRDHCGKCGRPIVVRFTRRAGVRLVERRPRYRRRCQVFWQDTRPVGAWVQLASSGGALDAAMKIGRQMIHASVPRVVPSPYYDSEVLPKLGVQSEHLLAGRPSGLILPEQNLQGGSGMRRSNNRPASQPATRPCSPGSPADDAWAAEVGADVALPDRQADDGAARR